MNRTEFLSINPDCTYSVCSEQLRELRSWRDAKHKATLRHNGRNVSWYVYTKSNAAPDVQDILEALSCACDDGEASPHDYFDSSYVIHDRAAHEHYLYAHRVFLRLSDVLGDATDDFLNSIRN